MSDSNGTAKDNKDPAFRVEVLRENVVRIVRGERVLAQGHPDAMVAAFRLLAGPC